MSDASPPPTSTDSVADAAPSALASSVASGVDTPPTSEAPKVASPGDSPSSSAAASRAKSPTPSAPTLDAPEIDGAEPLMPPPGVQAIDPGIFVVTSGMRHRTLSALLLATDNDANFGRLLVDLYSKIARRPTSAHRLVIEIDPMAPFDLPKDVVHSLGKPVLLKDPQDIKQAISMVMACSAHLKSGGEIRTPALDRSCFWLVYPEFLVQTHLGTSKQEDVTVLKISKERQDNDTTLCTIQAEMDAFALRLQEKLEEIFGVKPGEMANDEQINKARIALDDPAAVRRHMEAGVRAEQILARQDEIEKTFEKIAAKRHQSAKRSRDNLDTFSFGRFVSEAKFEKWPVLKDPLFDVEQHIYYIYPFLGACADGEQIAFEVVYHGEMTDEIDKIPLDPPKFIEYWMRLRFQMATTLTRDDTGYAKLKRQTLRLFFWISKNQLSDFIDEILTYRAFYQNYVIEKRRRAGTAIEPKDDAKAQPPSHSSSPTSDGDSKAQ